MPILRLIIFIFTLSLSATTVYAVPEYYFRQISLKEGMSQTRVSGVCTDHQGLIWVGTRFGLNCLDGEQIHTYYTDTQDRQTIPHNSILFVVEDDHNRLWIGTEAGLAWYNRDKDSFVRVEQNEQTLIAYTFGKLDDGILFLGQSKIYKLNYADGHLTECPVICKQPLNIYFVKAAMFDRDKGLMLLVSSQKGIWLYNYLTGELSSVDFIPDKDITSILVDGEKRIWVAPYGKGIDIYDKDGVLVDHISAPDRLRHNLVMDIKKRKDEVWIATDGGGITVFDIAKNTSCIIEHRPGDSHSVPVNSFLSLYNDDNDNMWAGSVRGGLIGIKEVGMKTYKSASYNSIYGLSEKIVTGTYEDTDGYIWLGTDGEGINRFDPQTGHFLHYPATFQTKVVSIIPYSDSELLLSIFSRGLFLFDKKKGTMRAYTVAGPDKHRQLFRVGFASFIKRLDKERFYLFADSVYLYNQTTRQLKTVTIDEKDAVIYSLQYIAGDEQTCYVHGNYEIFVLNNQTNHMRPICRLGSSIGYFYASCMDKNGDIWLGSGNGLYLYNIETNALKPVETNQLKGVYSLAFDRSERLWVGTHNGLYMYNPADGRMAVFGESDGVAANEYLIKPPLITRSGDIYLSGVMGLLHIRHDWELHDEINPSISLLNVSLNGAVAKDRLDSEKTSLSIPWDYTSLNVKVIVKENDLMRKKLFRFYLKGRKDEVIEQSAPSVALHALAVGDYELWASCNKINGDWSSPVKLLGIHITPPWWETKWFAALFGFAMLALVYVTIRIIIRRKETRMIWAMKEHEQKTYQEKIRFLINLSHELRTPLTLIYDPLKRILKNDDVKDDGQRHQLKSIYRQVDRIKGMVDMALNVKKIEEGKEKLNISEYNLSEWIRTFTDDFTYELEVKEISLRLELDETVGTVAFDSGKCGIILSNILMNAIKFSESSTVITLSTEIKGNYVRIAVADQGIGLANVDTNKLFNRFYQGNHNKKGSGIGLSYARMLVNLHKGSISAYNNLEGGATFWFELPLTGAGTTDIQPFEAKLLVSKKDKTGTDTVSFPLQKYVALVVEDEAELRIYLKQSLRPYFKKVYTACDGQEALEMIGIHQPDILVSDVMMPRMNGYELCRQVKSTLGISHIPVVLLTARTDSESTTTGYKQGADVYLIKPFDVDSLLAVLRNLLHNRGLIKQRYKTDIQPVAPIEDTISNADEQFILKLNAFINDHLSDPSLDVNLVASHMAMSRATLFNKLKMMTDVSIGDYINKFRMARAVELLSDKTLTILEISEMAGFSNQRYFSTVFKQKYGMTPSQYRQKKDVSTTSSCSSF